MNLLISTLLTLTLVSVIPSETTYVLAREPEYVVITAEITAYSEFDSCHYENCVMANGERAHIGAVACPRGIPLGVKVEIAGEEYECSDRTAKRYDGRWDIFMGYGKEAHTKALKFGINTLEVKIYQ